ncbi:MAG: glycosyltransferase family 4 protein [Planctomycetaceae bacterium]|jgi:beta-1,4-mannosyltransferase|nr:glycosyltransferase family 4 protein [Planctomycetaceae bacterium]
MATSARSIRAIHLPFDRFNPYQRRLFDELRPLGIEATGHKTSLHPAYRQWRTWHADILHYHWLYPSWFGESWKRRLRMECFFTELRLLPRRRPGLVWTIHNLAHHESQDRQDDHRFLARMARAFDACLVHSESARHEVLAAIASSGTRPDRLAHKIHVVPHGNYAGCYQAARCRDRQREQLGVGVEDTLFAFLGQLRPYKNVVGLVTAFRQGATDRGRLLISGKPLNATLDAEIRAAIASDPRVIYIPAFADDAELASNLEACDLVALPYRECLTSGAAILAMTYGKPILAPNRGFFREVLGPQGNPLYDDDQPSSLAEQIRRCCTSQDWVRGVGVRNTEAAALVSWNRVAERVHAIYASVLGRPCPAETG